MSWAITDEQWEAGKAACLAVQKWDCVGAGLSTAECCPDCGFLKLVGMECAPCLMAKTAAVPEAKSKLAVDSSTLQFRAIEHDGESVVEMGSGMGWVVIAKFPGVFGGVRAASYVQFMVENGRR